MDNAARAARPTVSRSSDPDVCGICSNLVIADCCCEMMGGDLIKCI